MYQYYIAIGSNLGNTIKNIDNAITILKQHKKIKIIKIAPYYFNPPLLPKDADESYYKMFCNTVLEIDTTLSPFELLQITQTIELQMKRAENHKFWSPRIIDIDILYCKYNNKMVNVSTDTLTIPHKEIFNRSFVLDPLSYLNSTLKINKTSVLQQAKKNKLHQSCIMAIVNITNNSFSGDGELNIKNIQNKIKKLVENAIPIIDIGCEATNPNAKILTYQEEIAKLKHIVNFIQQIKQTTFSTKFSIDTYHPETAEYAIKNGFDIINDVNCFKNKEMWSLMQKYQNIEAVIMHSLTPHSNKQQILDKDIDVITYLNNWTKSIVNTAKKNKINLNRIILDYGIGFGKNAFQSIQILKNINKIKNYNCRVLVGHSKKSFTSLFSNSEAKDRVFETIGISLQLQQKGVDIIRIHDAIETQKALIGFQNTI